MLAAFLVAAIPLFLLGLKIASHHPAFKRAVLAGVLPSVEGELSLGELEVGLASVQLADATVALGERGSIRISSASADLSLGRFLTNGFKVEKSIGNVIVSGVKVRLRLGCGGQGGVLPADRRTDQLFDSFPECIAISDGTLILEDAGTGRELRIDSIDLLAEKTRESVLVARAVGSLLGGEDNLESELTWELHGCRVTVSAEVSDAALSGDLPIPEEIPIAFHGGRMSLEVEGEGVPEEGRFLPPTVVRFEIDSASAELEGVGETINRFSVRGSFDGRTLVLSELAGRLAGADVAGSGAVNLEERRIERLTVDAKRLPLPCLAQLVGIEASRAEGIADVSARVEGPVGSPTARVVVDAWGMSLAEQPIDRLRVAMTVEGDRVEIEEATGSAYGGVVSVSGFLERGDPAGDWGFDLAGSAAGLDAAAVAGAFGIDGVGGAVDLEGVVVRGRHGVAELEALLLYRDGSVRGLALGAGAGGIQLTDGRLALVLRGDAGSYELSGTVGADPRAADLTLTFTRCPLVAILCDAPLWVPPLSIDGSIGVKGPLEDLALAGELSLSGGPKTGATIGISGGLTEVEGEETLRLEIEAPDAAIRGVPTPLSAEITVGRLELAVDRLELGDVARAAGKLGLGPDHPLQGSVVVSEASLPDVFRLATGSAPPFGIGGLLFASLSFVGTIEDPVATAQVQVGQGRAAGVENLDAVLVAALEDGVITLRELVVRAGGIPVIRASGTADMRGGLALTAIGERVPGPFVGASEDSRVGVRVEVEGLVERPTFDLSLGAVGGSFLGVPFDSLAGRATGAKGVLSVSRLSLKRRGAYSVSVSGEIPYGALTDGGAPAEGALSIDVEGDPMALIAELSPLIESAEGRGSLSALLVGDRTAVTVARCELDAGASVVVPTAVFDRIEDVEVRLSVVDGVITSGRIEGLIGGRAIRIASLREAAVGERRLVPLTIGGLDVGTVAISTDPRGVRACVPGLMFPGEVGKIAARGRDGANELLLSGPREHPLIWGELELSDAGFTYPFAASDAGLGSAFLSDAEWSLSVVAGRNLWYRRPDVELKVDRGGRLDFAGTPALGTLCVAGKLTSSHGTVRCLDTEFSVENGFVEFPSFCEPPRLYFETAARVEDGTTITLTMDSLEAALSVAAPGATLDESALIFSSDSAQDNTQEEIIAKLTYGASFETIKGEDQALLGRQKAMKVIGGQINSRVMRPLLTPIEGRIKRNLGLDLVRIEIDFIQHFLAQLDQWQAQAGSAEYQPFLADTRIRLGKYISGDWLFSYVGFAEAYEEDIGDQRLGLRHELGIEYEVSRNTSLSYRLVYDPALAGWDRRASIENRYKF